MTDETAPQPTSPKRRRSFSWRLALHGYRCGIIVAIAVLVRLQVQDEGNATMDPIEISLERVALVLPEAEASVPATDREGVYILNAEGERIGWAVTTLPTARRIIGFSGPTNVLIVTDVNNTIRGIEILSSQDTPEHLAAVRKDELFKEQFAGLDSSELAGRTHLDAVSGATLTSLAIIESVALTLGNDPPNYRFPDEITLEEVTSILPETQRLVPKSAPRGWIEVLDEQDNSIGTAWRTSPAADHIIGYQGPTDVLVVMDSDGKLKAVSVRESFDNDPYVRYVREDWSFPEYLAGYDLDQLASFDIEESEIEGVSGATMTSQSATQAVGVAAAAAKRELEIESQAKPPAQRVALNGRDLATLGVIAAALIIGFTNLRGKKLVQVGFGLLVIGYLGFFAGDILSLALLVGWAGHPVPWEKCIGLVALAIAAFAVPLFSKKQIYCNHLCPHGAAQMLVLRFTRKWHWKIPAKVRPVLAVIPAVLLGFAILIAFSLIGGNLAALEPFDAYVPTIAGWASLSIAVGGLIFSAFVPMGYCRYGCPTGAILSFVRWNGANGAWSIRDSVATLLLGVAIVCFWW